MQVSTIHQSGIHPKKKPFINQEFIKKKHEFSSKEWMVHTQKILKWTFKSLGPEIANVAVRERPCLIGCKATTEATEGKGGSH